MKLEKIKKHRAKIAALTLAGLFAFQGISLYQTSNSRKTYVNNNLVKIMEEQEKKLGIKHFGIPKISYKNNPNEQADFISNGSYKNGTIYLPNFLVISPEKKFWNTSTKYITFGLTDDAKKILHHELGHYYTRKLSESLGITFPKYSNPGEKFVLEKDAGIKIIDEGIAEYFTRTINNKKDNFKDSHWPKSQKGLLSLHVIYYGGYHLVKPIIDEYGKKGITYLITNPPNEKDLFDLPAYREKTLESLAKTK